MQAIYNAITGSKTTTTSKSQAKTPEEIKQMEQEALTSKSTVLKSTEETEALKQIVKDAERLSLDEKPVFEQASKIALGGDAEKPVEETNLAGDQSKKRSFDQISNFEINQSMVDETKVQPEELKNKEPTDTSPNSSKFETCEQEKVDKIFDDKISPNTKRLKLDNTPPKKDNLVSMTKADGSKTVEAVVLDEIGLAEASAETKKKGDDLKTDSKVDDGKAKMAESKEPEQIVEAKKADQIVETKEAIAVSDDKKETEDQFLPGATMVALVDSKIVSQRIPVDFTKATESKIAEKLDEKSAIDEPKPVEKVEDPSDTKDATKLPEEEKPSSIEQAYIDEVNKDSTEKKEEKPEQKVAES